MAANPMVIPEAERYAGLKAAVFEYTDRVARIEAANPNLARQWPEFFLFLVYPWILDRGQLSAEQKGFLDRRKVEVAALGFDGERVKAQLEGILAGDRHLAECCPTLLHFVNFLNAFFIKTAAESKRSGASQDQLDFTYGEFETLTYRQGRFKRIALSHVFNFDMEGNSSAFPSADAAMNIRIERLDNSTIPGILGESGVQAFLHPAGIGNCFVVEEEGASAVEDLAWLFEKWQKALAFAQVLQYFRSGVVHIGYSVPFFQPNWANQIRRNGLFFVGEPRRIPYENATKMYLLNTAEKERLVQWWRVATTDKIRTYLRNRKGKLRQAIYRAGTYYEASHQRVANVERLLALAIAVESLFSPTDQGELKFRICQSAAQFIGQNPDERKEIFKGLSKMYDRRSSLVHGSYNVETYDEGRFVTSEEIDEWAAYLRKALLGFLTIYFRGDIQADREPVLQRITGANFDDSEGDRLRQEADIDAFFTDLNRI
jgi:hypothetical protein